MSVCVLDLLVSSILGRPSATSTLRSELGSDFINTIQQSDRMDVCLLASYRIADIMDEISNKLYGEKAVSTDAAEQLLRKLEQWSDELPDTLRASSILMYPHAQEHTIGSLNVACLYYFAVTLVTRPFLISTLTARVASLRQSLLEKPPIQEDPVHAQLASACVDSAIYLVQTCLDVHKADMLLENMCIMK